jgi:hypothetical protein
MTGADIIRTPMKISPHFPAEASDGSLRKFVIQNTPVDGPPDWATRLSVLYPDRYHTAQFNAGQTLFALTGSMKWV